MSLDLDGLVYDEETDRIISKLTIKSSHRDATTVSRRIGINSYLTLLGRTRAPAMEDIGEQWNAEIGSGKFLYVTNWCEIRMIREARAHDRLVTKLYVTRVSSFRTRMSWEFFRETPDGNLLVAVAEQDTAFTRVHAHGQIEPTDMPDWLRVWLERQLELGNHPSRHIPGVDEVEVFPEVPRGPATEIRHERILHTMDFQTSTLNSNIGGNVYYQNYFEWMIWVTDCFFHSVDPSLFKNVGRDGEALVVGLRMEYLREIMPLDHVRLTLRAKRVGEGWAELEVTHASSREGGTYHKSAVGTVTVVFVTRDLRANLVPAPWPAHVHHALTADSLVAAGLAAVGAR